MTEFMNVPVKVTITTEDGTSLHLPEAIVSGFEFNCNPIEIGDDGYAINRIPGPISGSIVINFTNEKPVCVNTGRPLKGKAFYRERSNGA